MQESFGLPMTWKTENAKDLYEGGDKEEKLSDSESNHSIQKEGEINKTSKQLRKIIKSPPLSDIGRQVF